MIPLIIELDEPLKENEIYLGMKSFLIKDADKWLVGYVGIIKEYNTSDALKMRYGSLRATKYEKQKLNKQVV